jgi:hypothetical protein
METIVEFNGTNDQAILAWCNQWPAMGRYVANVTPAPGAHRYAHIPTVSFTGNLVTLSWCNIVATFTVGTCDPDGALIITDDIDWTDIDPAGRYLAHS